MDQKLRKNSLKVIQKSIVLYPKFQDLKKF